MYDDAWDANMQRITWNGSRLHGGRCPGMRPRTAACECPLLCREAVRQDADRDARDHSPTTLNG